MYRSYVAQRKYAVVLDEVRSSSASELQAVKLLAQYLHTPSKRCVHVPILAEVYVCYRGWCVGVQGVTAA